MAGNEDCPLQSVTITLVSRKRQKKRVSQERALFWEDDGMHCPSLRRIRIGRALSHTTWSHGILQWMRTRRPRVRLDQKVNVGDRPMPEAIVPPREQRTEGSVLDGGGHQSTPSARFHLPDIVLLGKGIFSLKLIMGIPQGRGMAVLNLSLELTHVGIDNGQALLFSIVGALARASLRLSDHRMEVPGIQVMQPLIIWIPPNRPLRRLRPLIRVR